MKSLLEYTDDELNDWIRLVRENREMVRSGKIAASQEVKRVTRVKAEKKAKSQGIEVIDMDDILKAFLK